jgi:2-methylcitrate dehydratase PrpD
LPDRPAQESQNNMTISETLAEYVFDAQYNDLPGAAISAAKRSLLDTLAVALAGAAAHGAREACAMAREEGGSARSSLWMDGHKVPPRAAVFANSLSASALDFDSLHQESVVHAGIVVVPASIAVAEDRAANGRQLVAAIALGDDIICRLGLATRANSGWFYTSVYGPIASAALAAKILGASPAQIANAMGMGYLSSSGTQQPAVEASVGKRMQGAFAAAAGVTAAYLASRDLHGPREIVEGRFGLHAMYEKGDPQVITENLGRSFENTRIAFKRFPSCQCNHAAIEGMLELKSKHNLEPGNVRTVEVFVSPYMHRLVGAAFDPARNPQVAAQFNIRYSIASILLRGRFGVAEILDEAVLDPRVSSIVANVIVTVDEKNTHNYAPVRLKITRHDGNIIEHTVKSFRGGLEHPLSDADLKEKLMLCVEAAGSMAGPPEVEAFYNAVMNIEDEPDVSAFIPRVLRTLLK